ncbi:hypothetical protein BB558_001131 [Smittium angustum]|uniref:Uncharacterized protein n=1 Tax=Smittium angustum TaxID=133377 RepID=A0A2U1JC99_SMIAN|nr:hypothetical protein BB558_001131 [Smittium angustum]
MLFIIQALFQVLKRKQIPKAMRCMQLDYEKWKKGKTSDTCETCNIELCIIPCFEIYHDPKGECHNEPFYYETYQDKDNTFKNFTHGYVDYEFDIEEEVNDKIELESNSENVFSPNESSKNRLCYEKNKNEWNSAYGPIGKTRAIEIIKGPVSKVNLPEGVHVKDPEILSICFLITISGN